MRVWQGVNWHDSLPEGGKHVLLGVGIALLIVILNVLTPQRIRLIGVAVLFVPQIWITGLPHVELATVAVLWTLMTCIAGLAARDRSRADSALVAVAAVFVAVTAVSLVWAVPAGMGNGVSTVVRGAIFCLWLREVIVVAKDEPGLLNTLAMWMVPGVAIQALLSIAFRLRPVLEEQFLRSKLALVFVGPQSERLYADMRNNVLYESKSGGLFVNGNMASLFGAIAGLLLIIAARRTGHRWLYAAAALALTGSIFTGSKTALILAPICAIAVAYLPHMLKVWAAVMATWLALLVPILFSIGADLALRYAPGFYAAVSLSVDGRDPLWKGAAQLFSETPLLGPGFGGWTEQMARFTDRPDLPPHNLLIAAWAYSGIAAALVALAFMLTAITSAGRIAAAQRTVSDRRTVVIGLCALAWVFIHGMADNTTIYGEQRSMILVALIIGNLYAMRPVPNYDNGRSDRDDGLAQRNQTPAGSSKTSGAAHLTPDVRKLEI